VLAALRRLVPEARFLCEDMTRLELPAASLDGLCSLYAIIHIPREEHRGLLQRFARLLRPGGAALLCMGAGEWTGVEEFYGAPMYWSHFDAATNLEMMRECGFEVLRSELVGDNLDPELGSEHLFVLGRKTAEGAM